MNFLEIQLGITIPIIKCREILMISGTAIPWQYPYRLMINNFTGFYDCIIYRRPGPKSGVWTDLSIRRFVKKKILCWKDLLMFMLLSVGPLFGWTGIYLFKRNSPRRQPYSSTIFPLIKFRSKQAVRGFFPFFFSNLKTTRGFDDPWNPWPAGAGSGSASPAVGSSRPTLHADLLWPDRHREDLHRTRSVGGWLWRGYGR